MSAPGPIVWCPNCGTEHRSKRKSGRCTECSRAWFAANVLAKDDKAEKPNVKFLRLLRATGRLYG